MEIKIVDGVNHLDAVKNLIIEYTKFLGRDLSFQSIDAELADLTEKYAPPKKNWFMRMIDWIAEHIFRIRKPAPNFICKKCGHAWHED